MTCTHDPPCSTLHIYHWHKHFIAARGTATALEFVEDESLIEEGEDFNPRQLPVDETVNVGADEDGCQCHEDDVTEEVELTPHQWICRQREGNETEFIVGEEW